MDAMQAIQNMEVWSLLRYCESVKNIKKIAKEQSNVTISSGLAFEIVWCLQQAREYYSSASNASVIVKPLLYFYGMVNFAEARILIRAGNKRLCQLAEGHGLSTDWSDPTSISSVKCQVTSRGTFVEFMDCLKNPQHVRTPNLEIVSTLTPTSSLVGHSFDLKWLFSRIPELRSLYALTYRERPNVLKAIPGYYSGGFLALYFESRCPPDIPVTEAELRSLFPTLRDVKLTEHSRLYPDSGITFQWDNWDHKPRELPPSIVKAPEEIPAILKSEEIFIVAGDYNISEISLHYMTMYFLGMLVRYRPELWMAALNHRGDDDVMALIEKFLRVSSLKFPNLILNEIAGEGHGLGLVIEKSKSPIK